MSVAWPLDSNKQWLMGKDKKDLAALRRRRARYGVGILIGILAVHLTKKVIRAIPVIGRLSRPLLGVLPTLVVGPALGAGFVHVYLEEGDLSEARSKVERGVRRVHGEAQRAVRDLHDEASRVIRRQNSNARRLSDSVEDAVYNLESDVAPLIKRHSREAMVKLDDLLQRN